MCGGTSVVEFMNPEQYAYWEQFCEVQPPETARLVVTGIIGCSVAFISVLFNLFLFFILAKNRKHRSSHLLYLTFLALFDIFVSSAYILLFPVIIYVDYFECEFLAEAWYTYMPVTLACSHIAITGSAFLIVAAAFERYRTELGDPRFVTISKIRTQFAKRNRYLISIGALLFAFIAKGPMVMELEIVSNLNCTGVTAWLPRVTEWSEIEPYKTGYKFWFRNIITIFLPFFLCFYLNIQIIRRLRLQHQGAKLFRFATSEHRQNIRSATLMLVFVTCSYLASNLMNVIVNILEMIDYELLMDPLIRPIYTSVTDLVSLLTITACALRLPIYYACNARIRGEVDDSLEIWWNMVIRTGKGGESPKTKRIRHTTVRYCQTGSGFMVYETRTSTLDPDLRPKCYGTGLDKIVLSVAMAHLERRTSATPRLGLANIQQNNPLQPDVPEVYRRKSAFE